MVVKYRDVNDELQEGHLDGYMRKNISAREYDHTEGRTILDKVSKFRYNLAMKKADKLMKKHMREMKNAEKDTTKTYVHVNQHVIRSNKKHNKNRPVITVKKGSKNTYCHEVKILVS